VDEGNEGSGDGDDQSNDFAEHQPQQQTMTTGERARVPKRRRINPHAASCMERQRREDEKKFAGRSMDDFEQDGEATIQKFTHKFQHHGSSSEQGSSSMLGTPDLDDTLAGGEEDV
jgi:hypothetical protein